MGKTSAERMKKLREKRKADPEYDTEKFKEKESALQDTGIYERRRGVNKRLRSIERMKD